MRLLLRSFCFGRPYALDAEILAPNAAIAASLDPVGALLRY